MRRAGGRSGANAFCRHRPDLQFSPTAAFWRIAETPRGRRSASGLSTLILPIDWLQLKLGGGRSCDLGAPSMTKRMKRKKTYVDAITEPYDLECARDSPTPGNRFPSLPWLVSPSSAIDGRASARPRTVFADQIEGQRSGPFSPSAATAQSMQKTAFFEVAFRIAPVADRRSGWIRPWRNDAGGAVRPSGAVSVVLSVLLFHPQWHVGNTTR